MHGDRLDVGAGFHPRPFGRDGQETVPYGGGRPWSETEQADSIECYYTICYSKPGIEAITWWDFCDPAFIPHGGLADEQLRPKEGYHRLKRLIASWR